MAKRLVSGQVNFLGAPQSPEEALRIVERTTQEIINRVKIVLEDHARTLEGSEKPLVPPSYTVGGLPAADAYPRGIVYVSNEVDGETIAFSDGTDWRRVSDLAVVST